MTTHNPALMKTLLIWEMEKLETDKMLPIFDVLLNPARNQEMNDLVELVDKRSLELFANMDFSQPKAKRVLLTVLWFSALPCDQLAIYCTWKGQVLPCGRILKVIPTDNGFCCSFNHGALSMTLRNSTFARTIEEIERRHVEMSLGEHSQGIWEEWSEEIRGNFSDLDLSPKKGKQNGLTVVLDMKSTTLTPSTLNQDFKGVQAAVTPRDEVNIDIIFFFSIL